MGQPRIWLSMSRDGLLPPIFAKINPKTQTPGFSTILTGFLVGIPALFMNLTEVTDLTSIGTLFAFVLVCGGILVLQLKNENYDSKFKVPYINSQWIFTPLMFFLFFIVYQNSPETILEPVKNFHIPSYLFFSLILLLIYLTLRFKLSLIPVLGITSCFYLMTHIAEKNWAYFFGWLVIGLVFYFTYGVNNSKLKKLQ
jgi:amino acid transporter